jgi:hypothetical protein
VFTLAELSENGLTVSLAYIEKENGLLLERSQVGLRLESRGLPFADPFTRKAVWYVENWLRRCLPTTDETLATRLTQLFVELNPGVLAPEQEGAQR